MKEMNNLIEIAKMVELKARMKVIHDPEVFEYTIMAVKGIIGVGH